MIKDWFWPLSMNGAENWDTAYKVNFVRRTAQFFFSVPKMAQLPISSRIKRLDSCLK